MNTTNKIIAYRVRQIRSQFADTRDRQERGRVERKVIETADLNEAKEAYQSTRTGMEVDKELVAVSMIGDSEHEEIIELVDRFLNEAGKWIEFKEWVEQQGYTLKELGFPDEN